MSQVAESIALNPLLGEVAEWSNVPDSKSGVPKGTAGSNPALSANKKINFCWNKISLFYQLHLCRKYQQNILI